jgi:hypothetical protein
MRNIDWKKEIVTIVMIKQALARVDKRNLYPHHLPKIRASEKKIEDCESALGFCLNDEHRDFLLHADGWDGFVLSTNLFGCPDFLGSGRYREAQSVMDTWEAKMFCSLGGSRHDFFPIAYSELDRDLFTMRVSDGKALPAVFWTAEPSKFWTAEREVDRFPSFHEFFLSMADYNRLAVEDEQKNP